MVSIFDCPFSEFEAMVKKVDKEQGYVFCSKLEIIKVNENKAMILMNCSDLEKFGVMLGQPESKQWDIDNNCFDTVYNLELIDWIKPLPIPVIAACICWKLVLLLIFTQNQKNKLIIYIYIYGNFFMKYFQELWNNQPNIVIGVGVATLVMLGIYIALLNTYK